MTSSMATAASIPAASVSLHPLASRDGQHSSTIVSVQVPQTTPQRDGLPPLEDIQATLDAPMLCDDQSAHPPLTPRIHTSNGHGHNGHSTETHQYNGAAAYAALPGAFADAEGQQYHQKVWGIQHEDINKYPVIDDQPAMCTYLEEDNFPNIFSVDDAPPIRAMTAAQLNELHKQYLSLDVPHSVVFPFLHGVDGSNVAQNTFFKAPLSGQPSPNYRGLTIVRADLPTPPRDRQSAARRKRTSSVGSKLSMGCTSSNGQQSHGRTDSTTSSSISSHATAATSVDSRPSSEGNNEEENYGKAGPLRNDMTLPLSATGSSASISSSLVSSEASANSLFSHHDHRFDSHTSIETGQTDHDEDMASILNKTEEPHRGLSATPDESFESQPEACLLTSTMLPYELIWPPVMVDHQSSNCYYARPDTKPRRNDSAMIQTANFISPKQAEGVNLRNFKIQAIKYATISDIVLYCPTGYHEGMLSYAQWFRDAHEGSYDERCERGLGGLRYNVFIVTEPFDVFERHYPHLVAVDRLGTLRNRVDFIDREREEMQRLTAAAPIDDNVWLGCTGDSPSLDSDATPAAAGKEFNPNAFSVSIEFHEQGEVLDSARLLQASQCLDQHRWGDGTADGVAEKILNNTGDDGWNRDGLESPSSSPSLSMASGMNGSTKVPQRSKTDLPATASGLPTPASPFVRREGSVVHLECHSFSADPKAKASDAEVFNEMQKKVDSILRLCAWIQAQAQPWKASLQPATTGLGHGILAGALRSVHYARQNTSGSYGRTSSVRHAHREVHNGTAIAPWSKRRERRVLLHCADGYTETSILALAYLMYSRGLSLPEAYLDLQDRAKRSFFVYNRDLPLLKEIEKQIGILRRDAASEGSPEHTSRPRNKHGFPWLGHDEHYGKRRNASCTSPRRNSASSLGQEAAEHNSWMRGLVGWVGAGNKRSTPVNNSSDALLNPPSRTVTPTPASMASQASLNTVTIQDGPALASPSAISETPSTAWFHSPRFEGSFPSRILPFLYLGNLNHALNASMLHALGITHVVSVGESALHPPAAAGAAVAGCNGGQTALPSPAEPESANSLWHEEQAGRISVLDLRNVSDDGIDPLRSTMRRAVEYIEAARRAGGKVLVHCRVGVSRSTTIVLAYVMAHLDLTLVESYLLVRSRRLSILIQPHLLFFWELRGWESYVASQKLKRRLALEAGRSSQDEAQDAKTALADAHFSLAGLSLQGNGARSEVMDRIASVGSSCGFGSTSDGSDSVVGDDLDVDIGAGAGSPYHLNTGDDVSRVAFGSGSHSGIPAEALRLSWGFLCREITVLNDRYF